MFMADALPILYRAKAAFLSGDTQQMPPSDFFSISADIENLDDEDSEMEDEDSGDKKIFRFKIKRQNYLLDVYTQVKKDLVTDLFIRLPQHFFHDPLLTELQKKWNKQDRYVRHDKSAVYVWLNRDNTNIIYQGSCSITCFPMFLEIVSNDKSVTPMYDKLNLALPKW